MLDFKAGNMGQGLDLSFHWYGKLPSKKNTSTNEANISSAS